MGKRGGEASEEEYQEALVLALLGISGFPPCCWLDTANLVPSSLVLLSSPFL